MRGYRDGAVHGDRHELRRLQCAGGKGSFKGGRGELLLGKPAHKFHGSGGKRPCGGDHQGGGGGWIRRFAHGRRAVHFRRTACFQRAGGDAAGQGDACVEAQAVVFHRVSHRTDVFFHGTYDVEFPGSGGIGGQSCRDGADSAVAHDRGHGDQPEVFHQRL